jgi:glucose-6-phosphate 1-epimerase
MAKVPVAELQERFGIGDQVHFEADQHGMERAVINTRHALAIIYLNGAHITHFQPIGQKPILFLSGKSNFIPGKAIRGGIPIIYPWFGAKKDDPKAAMHGFARTSQWQVEKTDLDADAAELIFSLESLRFHVRVSESLELTLEVRNSSATPLIFEEALHSYFSVSDAREVGIHGLSNQAFIDKTDGMKRKTSRPTALRLTGETDRVYVNSTTLCQIEDPDWNRQIRIEKSNSFTTVLWNPWMEKAKKMSDLADHEWQNFLCIETANAADNAITLAPGATHHMRATISSITK